MWAEAKALTRISEVSNEAGSGNAPSDIHDWHEGSESIAPIRHKAAKERERQREASEQAPVAPACIEVSNKRMRRAVPVNDRCGRRRRRNTTSGASTMDMPLVNRDWQREDSEQKAGE